MLVNAYFISYQDQQLHLSNLVITFINLQLWTHRSKICFPVFWKALPNKILLDKGSIKTITFCGHFPLLQQIQYYTGKEMVPLGGVIRFWHGSSYSHQLTLPSDIQSTYG
jgi:hypothetical protein